MTQTRSTEFIHRLKVKFYKQALLLAFLIVFFLWIQILVAAKTRASEFYIFPVYLVFCGVSLVLFYKYDIRYLRVFEAIGYILSFCYFTSHFVSEFYAALSLPELAFRKFLIWVPVMYGLSFLIFPLRQALRLSGAFLASIIIPGTVYGIIKWGQPGFQNDLTLLLQIYTSGLIYTALFYIIAALREKFTELDQWARAAATRADTDALTNAYSRAKTIELLETYLSTSNLRKLPFSTAFMDIDDFKKVNDTYGHATGDFVLRRVVDLLVSNLRDQDVLGRYGGDEFLLILPETDQTQAYLITRRLQQVICEADFGNLGAITISIGVASARDGDSKESLLSRADSEMYQEKINKRQETVI